MRHFNELTPAEDERLALLMEEMAEAIQIIGKIMRHGYESHHPDGGPTNRGLLEKEMGHVSCAMSLMIGGKDISVSNIMCHNDAKKEYVRQYLHHQAPPNA